MEEGKESQQKPTDYTPTVAEIKLPEVLLNPEHRLKYITEKKRGLLPKIKTEIYYFFLGWRFSYFSRRSFIASSRRSFKGFSRLIANILMLFWRSFSILVDRFFRVMIIYKTGCFKMQ